MSIKGFSVSGVTDRYDYNYLDNKPEIHSIPTGGTAGQVLAKRSGADYAVEWADQTGGGGDITVDDVLSNTSENPVQNKVITAALATKADQAGIQQVIEDEVDDWLSVQAPSIGTLSYAAKQALLACFRHVAWIDDQGQSYYNALESELFPDATLESITAVFTQGSSVIYDTDSLDTLRQYLVVTATYYDSTTATVTDYTLSGTLTEGTSTITVSYGGKTDTFDVTVTHAITPMYNWDFTSSMTDTIAGKTASTSGTRDSDGVHLEEKNKYLTISNAYDRDRTIWVTFTTFNTRKGGTNSYHGRVIVASSSNDTNSNGQGFNYRNNGNITFYTGAWDTSSISATGKYNYFANSTLKMYVNANGIISIYRGSELLLTSTGAISTSLNGKHYVIGGTTNDCVADVVVTGVKIFNGFVV